MQRWYGGDPVTAQGALDAGDTREAMIPAVDNRRWLVVALALAALAVVVAASLVWPVSRRPPTDASLEAGFARDMMVHHDQAVAMALAIRDRTADPRVKSLATDIILTQQNQIGQMLGWLNLWGLPATSTEPPMAWMGRLPQGSMPSMATPAGAMGEMTSSGGRMPGMASPEELANLERMTGDAADAEFLRLMIRHHRGAIPMAEAALAQSSVQPVRDLARSIVASQQLEITAMEALLAEKTTSPDQP